MMKRSAILFFLVLNFLAVSSLFAAKASPQNVIAEVPYRIGYEGWITLPVLVNGQGPYDFIVDTGATITLAFQNLADQQVFQPTGGAPLNILGLSSTQTLPPITLGTIGINGLPEVQNHIGVILPDWSAGKQTPAGVLGLDVLTLYNVEIDPQAGLLRFYSPDRRPDEATKWKKNKLLTMLEHRGRPLYATRIRAAGRRLTCIVDLGASGTIMNFAALAEFNQANSLDWDRRSGLSSRAKLRDIFDETRPARVVTMRQVKMGKTRWRNATFIVHDAEIFRQLGYANKPLCLVGTDLLGQHKLYFDFSDKSLYIGP